MDSPGSGAYPESGSDSPCGESGTSYRIGELAAIFGLTVRTLRYYEELGLLKSNDRGEGIHRRYPERNVVHLRRIAQLKSYGLSLTEIKEFFALAAEDRTGEACRRRLIERYRQRIEEEEIILHQVEARIRDLRWHVEQLESVTEFFECPGRQCAACAFAPRCELALGRSAAIPPAAISEEEA